MYRYLFDMDGSLFFSDELNGESYNYALRKFGYEAISCSERLTRSVVKRCYPRMSAYDLDRIIEAKQDYFMANVRSVRENEILLSLLKTIGPRRSVLWTAGSRKRIEEMLKAFSLEDAFSQRFYSLKQDIPSDVNRICTVLQCRKEHLAVFEDDAAVARRLSDYGVSCLVVIPHAGAPVLDRRPC